MHTALTTSGQSTVAAAQRRGLKRSPPCHSSQVAKALIGLHPFIPDKLQVQPLSSGSSISSVDEVPGPMRRYTLTHSDWTGDQMLTIGFDFRTDLSLYTQLIMRDEVHAEWMFDDGTPSLHLYCLVSGHLPRGFQSPAWRDNIFRRDVPLVLDSFLHAESALMEALPELKNAEVYVHFDSDEPAYACTELWGILGDRSTWKPVPPSLLLEAIKRLLRLHSWLLPIIYWCLGSQLAGELRHELAADDDFHGLTLQQVPVSLD